MLGRQRPWTAHHGRGLEGGRGDKQILSQVHQPRDSRVCGESHSTLCFPRKHLRDGSSTGKLHTLLLGQTAGGAASYIVHTGPRQSSDIDRGWTDSNRNSCRLETRVRSCEGKLNRCLLCGSKHRRAIGPWFDGGGKTTPVTSEFCDGCRTAYRNCCWR